MLPEIIFTSDGYKKIITDQESIVAYFRQEKEECLVVADIDYHDTAWLTGTQVNVTLSSINQFLQSQGYGNIRCLCIVSTYSSYVAEDLMGETAEYWVHDTYHNELDTRDITPQEFRPLLESLEYYVAEGENAFLQKTQKKNLLSRENLLRMTNLIVLVNILVFIWLEMEGSTQNTMFMLEHGAMYLPYMKEYGQWYRLLSSMFMHFGIVHLINNMVVLFCIGGDLERAMGKIRYLILYLVSGVASNLVSCQYYETVGKNVVSCGASGAIFGVIGGLLFVVISNKGRYENLSMRRMILFVILSIYSGMSTPNVNMAAHLSGLIVGFFVAAFLYNRKKNGDSMEEVK